jgi:hypothetical protein
MPRELHLYDAVTDDYLCTVKALAPRVTRDEEGDGIDFRSQHTTRLILPRGLTRAQRQQAALAAEHTMRWRCHCEHDCCGHSFGWSRARIADRRTLAVTTYVARNV